MIQFPRLIAEINATQMLDMKALCESMDLEPSDVDELFDRAEEEWERVKKSSDFIALTKS
jgi:hypothetical protein